nr:hypothetical protein [Tanacetum cinerariifolium]
MNLLNEECLNCVYGNGKPLTCNKCGGMLRGGFCFPCNLEAENSYNCYQDDPSYNSNYLPQPQYENYLCNLCGNNSHDGYDCQQQFSFVYEQEPSYNQNYDDNYYPHDLPSFSCCDNYLKELAEYENSQSRDRPIFLNDDEKHSVQNRESLENPSNEIDVSNSNEEKEEPPQDSNIRQLIREECCVEASEEQKQSMEDTMLELVKICQQKEFLCIHDNVDDLIESALNSKLLLINSNSQRLDKKEQEVKNVIEQPAERGNRSIESLQNFRVIHKSSISFKNTSQISSIHAVATILSTKEPEYSSSMGYEHSNTTPKTESDEIIKTSVEEIVPILSENETMMIFQFKMILKISKVDLEDISQIQDVVLREKLLSITRLISNIESLNDNSTPDRVLNSFKSDNFLSDTFSPEFETFCDHTKETRSGNTIHADNSLPEYDSFCLEIKPDQERLINLVKNDIFDDSNDPFLEEADLFLASDNSIPPGIENVADDSEGDICFLEELLIGDSILSHESFDSNFEDNPSIPRPPPEPPDAKTDTGEEIPVVMNNEDKFDEDYYFFMFDKVFSLLFAESEDTIFDPGISD